MLKIKLWVALNKLKRWFRLNGTTFFIKMPAFHLWALQTHHYHITVVIAKLQVV